MTEKCKIEYVNSKGIRLDTQNSRNITLYEKFGYMMDEEKRVNGIDTWYMFKSNVFSDS